MAFPKTVFATFLISILPILVFVIILFLANFFFTRKFGDTSESVARKQLTMLILILVSLVFLVATLPLTEPLKGRILWLFGILFGGSFALSSIRFFANFLAGVWLKSTGSFHKGDFIRSGDFSGLVLGSGLLHTEIRSEDRVLIILPNLFLVSHPVKVTLMTDQVVSTEIRAGCRVPRETVIKLLTSAAEMVPLKEIAVNVLGVEKGWVTYRVGGRLAETEEVPAVHFRLNETILTLCQEEGMEWIFCGNESFPEKKRVEKKG